MTSATDVLFCDSLDLKLPEGVVQSDNVLMTATIRGTSVAPLSADFPLLPDISHLHRDTSGW